MSLALPFEVIERVIDHCSDSVATLYSFTLTCRDLNPRSTIVLLRRVSFKDRKQIFAFCDVLHAKPHLREAVRAIAVPVTEFAPHPLLRLLDNLTEIQFKPPLTSLKSSSQSRSSRRSVIHPSVSTYCRLSADHIQSLALRRLTLYSFSALSRLLLSFRKVKTLFCMHLKVEKDSEDWEPVGRILSQRMHLETLTVQVDDNSISLRPLELLVEAGKHTVQWLLLNLDFVMPVERSVDNLVGVLPSPSWVHLTTLVVRFPLKVIEQIAEIVSHIGRPPKLKKIVIEFRIATIKDMVQFLHSEPSSIKRPELETALLQFAQPHIRFSLIPSLNVRSEDFWRGHLREYFPVLRTRNAVSLKAKYSPEKFGHDSRITTAIAISADSRWAATGSDDDTIIIWDLSDGGISQEWFVQTPANGTDAGVASGLADPHPRRHLTSLSFSPDSLYLMSTGLAPGVTVWDICRSDTPYKLASLGDNSGVVQRCMWSPDGDSILAKFSNLNGIMCKWEASTLRQLGAHRTGHGVLQVLSPNGRWLLQVTGVSRVGNIWDVASGELCAELRAREPTSGIVAGVFDPSSTRLAAGYSGVDSSIRIWDVESGQCCLVLTTGLRTNHAAQCHRVEYSPNGKLILSMFTSASGSRTCIWSASKGALIHCLKTPDYGDPTHSCFSPCSRFVASISAEGSVVLWWTHDGSSFAELSGPNGSPVEHVAITPDGRRLCYGCDDGTVFFCDIIHADDPNATMIW